MPRSPILVVTGRRATGKTFAPFRFPQNTHIFSPQVMGYQTPLATPAAFQSFQSPPKALLRLSLKYPEPKTNNGDDEIDIYTPVYNNGYNKAIRDAKEYIDKLNASQSSLPIIITVKNALNIDSPCKLFGAAQFASTINYGNLPTIQLSSGDSNKTYAQILNDTMVKPLNLDKVRFVCSGLNNNTTPEKQFDEIYKNVSCNAMGQLIAQAFPNIAPPHHQFQNNVTDLNYSFKIDGFTSIEFNLLANTSLTLYLYPKNIVASVQPIGFPIQMGSTGVLVELLQAKLKEKDITVVVDRFYGEATQNALRRQAYNTILLQEDYLKIVGLYPPLKVDSNPEDILEPIYNEGYNKAIGDIRVLNEA